MDPLELRAARLALESYEHKQTCQNPVIHAHPFSQLMYSYGETLNALANMLMEIDHLRSGQSRVFVDELEAAISDALPEHVKVALGRQ